MRELEPQATEKNIRLSADISPDLEPVYMPADYVKSIWTNLISNAIKYTPPGGKINILLHQENAIITGVVHDTGIGIPADGMDKLFSEFYRARNAKELNIPGTGLGLAIIKQIIEKAGGEIQVELEVGKGSTFTFTLPIAEVLIVL